MSVQTYTVTEILNQREWAPADDPTKKTVFYEFRADGVDKVCSIGRKPGNELKVGDSFEATSTEDRGKLKLKRVQQFGGGGGGGKDYKADPAKQRAEAMRSALHAASGYVIAMKGAGEEVKSDHVDALAKRWYRLITNAMNEEAS